MPVTGTVFSFAVGEMFDSGITADKLVLGGSLTDVGGVPGSNVFALGFTSGTCGRRSERQRDRRRNPVVEAIALLPTRGRTRPRTAAV